jgi:protein gp37
MADETGIAWCDSTINLWIGCTKLTAACDNCYAEKLGRRFGVEWNAPPVRTKQASWGKIPQYQRGAARFAKIHGRQRRVFINSLSDFFDNQAPQAWRDSACIDMEAAPDVVFILVTKRPQNVTKMVPKHWIHGGWPKHVWLLVTTENQKQYDLRLGWAFSIPGVPVIGVSMEPMLEPIHPFRSISLSARERAQWASEAIKRPVPVEDVGELSWAIIGGESGSKARPMPPIASVQQTTRLLRTNGRAVFVKQMSQRDFPDTYQDHSTFPAGLTDRRHPA